MNSSDLSLEDTNQGLQEQNLAQDVQMNKPGQEGSGKDSKELTPFVPARIPQVGFNLEPLPGEADKKLIRNRQPDQRIMEAMQAELIEQTHTDVRGEIFCLIALLPK